MTLILPPLLPILYIGRVENQLNLRRKTTSSELLKTLNRSDPLADYL